MTDEAIRKKRKYARISLPKGMRVAWHGADLQLFSRVRTLARKIHDFRSTKGLAMVQIRCLRGFETKSEAFA